MDLDDEVMDTIYLPVSKIVTKVASLNMNKNTSKLFLIFQVTKVLNAKHKLNYLKWVD